MTLAPSVDRGRGRGEKRSRSRTADALPQPRAVRREVHELALRVHVFASVYALEHDALASLASSDVHVQTGPSDTTVSSLMDRENEAARDRCREAVKLLRRAANNVEEALRAFGPLAEQPTEPSPYAVVDRSSFNRALHEQRERELRAR